nr:MAG TPA: hypothetical protein [Caudoviricetes sp.]
MLKSTLTRLYNLVRANKTITKIKTLRQMFLSKLKHCKCNKN